MRTRHDKEAICLELELPVIPDTFQYDPPDPADYIELLTKNVVYHPQVGRYVVDVKLSEKDKAFEEIVVGTLLREFGWKEWRDEFLNQK
ncbi:MAG: hypothetical protein KW788_04230 [Candidatus Doudnabacteria bacterium]|nr:hypothetical protein [Candidatus Doudnabacteria bacterium]